MKQKIKIIIFISTLIFTNLVFINQARADAWGTNAAAAMLKQMMEQIDRQIYGAIMGALKQAAVETINQSVSTMISDGGSGGSLIVENVPDEFFYKPAQETAIYMNDWFKMTQRGKGSSANYLAAGGGEGVIGSYTKQLELQARSATIDQQEPPPCEISDPSSMFSQGNWRQFDYFISNPNCNMGYVLRAQEETMNTYNQKQTEAIAKFIAYGGFRAQEENGQVITPGSTIKDTYSNVQDLGNKIIAGANTIPEVITAVVTKIATQAIRQGIGNAQRNVQRDINNINSGYSKEFNSSVSNPQDIFNCCIVNFFG
jgi:hypothetical protein